MRTIIRLCFFLIAVTTISLHSARGDNAAKKTEDFIRFTQLDPLFAWPDTNLDHMEIAIEQLTHSRRELSRLVEQQYGSVRRSRVETALYPTDFLREMVKLETFRRKLSSQSAKPDLSAYQTQLEVTIRSYQSYIDKLLPILAQTVADQRFEGVEYHSGRSSFKHLIAGLESFHNQSARAFHKARARWKCLENDELDCDKPTVLVIPRIPLSAFNEDAFQSPTANIISTLRRQSKEVGREVSPPWAALNKHQCFPEEKVAYYFLWEANSGSEPPIWRADLTNDVVVHDHRINEKTTNKFELALDKSGGNGFLHQPVTSHYTCPDIGSDTAQLRAITAVYRKLKSLDWITVKANYPNLENAVRQLEKEAVTITRQNFVREDVVQNFMHDLSMFLSEIDSQDSKKQTQREIQRDLEEILVSYRLKTSQLSHDIMFTVYYNTAIGDYVVYSAWDYIEELLFTRNAPELLLGGSNPSIITNNYPQVEWHRKDVSPRLHSFKKDLSKQYSTEEFTEILLNSGNANYDLNLSQDRPYLIRK